MSQRTSNSEMVRLGFEESDATEIFGEEIMYNSITAMKKIVADCERRMAILSAQKTIAKLDKLQRGD